MLGLQIYKNDRFNVRVQTINGVPYFSLFDSCNILGIKNTGNVVARLKQDGIRTMDGVDSLGRKNTFTFINESNLYKVIFMSRKKEAEAFTDWVTSEVLPAIRENGMYAKEDVVKKIMDDPYFGIELLQNYARTMEENKKLVQKCEFVDRFMECNSAILVRDYAKLLTNAGIQTGEKRLYAWLKQEGYLMSNNRPYQNYVDQGLFKLKETFIEKPNNSFVSFTTMITPKGQKYFHDKLKGV